MASLSGKDRELLRKLHALMGSDNLNETKVAHQKINELLKSYNLAWSEIPNLLHEQQQEQEQQQQHHEQPSDLNVLDLFRSVLDESVSLTEDQITAVVLWIAHTHLFSHFRHTPRLFLTSPVRSCGKTTLLTLIEKLVPNPERIDGATDAVLFRVLDRQPTLLLDEVDNADLGNRPITRQVLNTGHSRQAGKVARFDKGEVRRFSVFAPVAIAAIRRLHLPLMDRSIIIKMVRARRKLKDVDFDDWIQLYAVNFFRHNAQFLNLHPEMPVGFKNRLADNWLPLIAVADLCGGDWPALARQTALAFSRSQREEDPEILAIEHCLAAFRDRGGDRLKTADLLANLHGMDSAPWGEWSGVKNNKPPHPLTPSELAALLRDFEISPKPLNPLKRRAGDKTARGYFRKEFEAAWALYGPPASQG